MWYDCVSIENMNIARVSPPSGLQEHILVGLFIEETCICDGIHVVHGSMMHSYGHCLVSYMPF